MENQFYPKLSKKKATSFRIMLLMGGSTPETTSTVSNQRSKIITNYNLKVINKLNIIHSRFYHSTVRYDYKANHA